MSIASSAKASEPPRIDIQPVGGPVRVAWREGTLTRAKELESLAAWVRAKNPGEHDAILEEAIGRCGSSSGCAASATSSWSPRRS
jgi:hypothetical protein